MKTFGELSKKKKLKLFEAWLDGKQIQKYVTENNWLYVDRPGWCPHVTYRIEPEPEIKKPDVPWEVFSPQWKYFAIDKDGEMFVYAQKPEIRLNASWGKSHARLITDLIKINTNDCPWDQSLVKRPE